MTAALVGGIVMLALLFCDLLTKAIAAAFLAGGAKVPVIPGFLQFAYYENDGFAFGLGSKTPWLMVIVTILTVVMIIGIAVLFFTVFKKNRAAQMTLAVIEAGALGNLIDRLCLGYVRDFADVSAFKPFAVFGSGFNFGICNLADFFITFGAVALLIILLFVGPDAVIPIGKKRKAEAAKGESAEETVRADAKEGGEGDDEV